MRAVVRIFIVVIGLLTAALAAGTCSQSRQKPTVDPDDDESVRMVVTNNNWSQATVRFHCSSGLLDTIHSLEMGQTETVSMDLRGCRDLLFTIELLAKDENYLSTPIMMQPGECLEIDIAPSLIHTSWLPCRAA